MIQNHRRNPRALPALAFLLAAAGFMGTSKAQDSPKSPTQESSASAVAAKDKWQEGEACVKLQAPDCPSEYRGACRTGRADGCTHDACTAAKNQARANLRAFLQSKGVEAKCSKYIQSTAPCKNGPGCK